jgi:hypothetical protein
MHSNIIVQQLQILYYPSLRSNSIYPKLWGFTWPLQAGSLLHKRKEPGNEVVMINNWLINLVPLACGPQEGMWGSGIIHLRDKSDWPLIWNAQFNLSQDSWLPATDYPRASRSFEDHRLGERDCWLIRLIKQHWATLTANDFVTH